jgi:hypothetical protein
VTESLEVKPYLSKFLQPQEGPLTPFLGPARGFPESKARDWVMEYRDVNRDPFLTPWDSKVKKLFPRLLTEDRATNLKARQQYYKRRGQIRSRQAFTMGIAKNHAHVAWTPKDGRRNFAYSIGLYYLYNLPEVALIDESADPLTLESLRELIEALVRSQIGGELRLSPGQALTASTESLPEVQQSVAAHFGSACFEPPTDEEIEECFWAGQWFCANYLDVTLSDVPFYVVRR